MDFGFEGSQYPGVENGSKRDRSKQFIQRQMRISHLQALINTVSGIDFYEI